MKAQQGFSLIELMIALLLGLLVTASFLQLMVSTTRSTTFHEDLSIAQSNGRHSLYLISKGMRMGGYRNLVNGTAISPFYQGSCGGSNPCTRDGGGTNNDQVAVQYESVNGLDCAGNTVPSGGLTADLYYIANDPANDNISSLFCRGFDPSTGSARGAGQPLVQGVERLQAVYGIEGSTPGTVDQYVTAGAVSDWRSIRAIRLGVLVSSGMDNTVFDLRTRQFNLLNSGNLSFTDNSARFVYTTAVRLNNTGL